MKLKKIILANDHGGYELKREIVKYFKANGIEFEDSGCNSVESCDYPEFAHRAAVLVDKENMGIFICGSGNGINMSSNAHTHVRSALCWKEEIAKLARLHNDANIMCLPGRFITVEEGIKCVEAFITTEFEGGRHLKRVNKIKQTDGNYTD